MLKKYFRVGLGSAVSIFVLSGIFTSLGIAKEAAKETTRTVSFHVVAVEIGGTKFWLPSTLHVKKGDHVKIHLANNVKGPNNIHGYAIDDFKAQALVEEKGADIEFTADKSGIFPIRCHLHPAHVGGQLIVQD